MKKKLYLICPDCCIEEKIRLEYGNHTYFLTALGSVFNMANFEYAEEVNDLLNRESISDICIVNDIQCSFLENTFTKKFQSNTRAEQVLNSLYESNEARFESLRPEQQQKILARLNIVRQAKELMKIPIIGNKISNQTIKVSGLLYDRKAQEFEKFNISI